MELKVFRQDGSETGRTVTLDESIFASAPNDHAIWLDVKATQANMRQGTHKTKERSENAHSTRKLYRQKGTGGARAGDAKSPIRRGGGTTFGPRPRDYSQRVNKKTKRLARRSALAYKAQEEAIRLVDAFAFDAPSTRTFAGMLKSLGIDAKRVLVLTDAHNDTLFRSGRNIQGVQVRAAGSASTLDIMQAGVVVMQEGALDVLRRHLGSTGSEDSDASNDETEG